MKHLSFWTKTAYGTGDMAFNLAYQAMALFLMFFYTDILGIPPLWAGLVFFFSKIWDAVTDPLMGFLVDKTKSPWGNKRPYLLFGALPFGLSIFLMFLSPPLGEAGRIVWAFATFIFFSTAITVVNIPYGAMTASLTLDSKDRSHLSAFRMVFSLVGTLVAAGLTKPLSLALGGGAAGWQTIGLLYGAVGVTFTLLVFFKVKEVQVKEEPQGFKLKDGFLAAAKNPPFIILSLSTVLLMTAINILASSVNYYYKYVLLDEGGVTFALAALFVTAIFFVPVFNFIGDKTSKKVAYLLGLGSIALALILLIFIPVDQPGLTLLAFILCGVGMATIFLSPWSMVPDTVEYGQWKSGHRREGALYGFFFFSFKLGAALAGYLVGQVLSLSGYVADAAPTPQVQGAIKGLISVVPLVLLALGAGVVWFYPLNRKLHGEVVTSLKQKGQL